MTSTLSSSRWQSGNYTKRPKHQQVEREGGWEASRTTREDEEGWQRRGTWRGGDDEEDEDNRRGYTFITREMPQSNTTTLGAAEWSIGEPKLNFEAVPENLREPPSLSVWWNNLLCYGWEAGENGGGGGWWAWGRRAGRRLAWLRGDMGEQWWRCEGLTLWIKTRDGTHEIKRQVGETRSALPPSLPLSSPHSPFVSFIFLTLLFSFSYITFFLCCKIHKIFGVLITQHKHCEA